MQLVLATRAVGFVGWLVCLCVSPGSLLTVDANDEHHDEQQPDSRVRVFCRYCGKHKYKFVGEWGLADGGGGVSLFRKVKKFAPAIIQARRTAYILMNVSG